MKTIAYKLSFYLIAYYLFICIPTSAQISYNTIRFKQISIAEGLPNNTVHAITQDNQGFIWFGTRNGLSRYDGYNIVNYFHNENDSTSLNDSFIQTLYNDSTYNCIWISTENGICKYDPVSNKFIRYKIKNNQKQDVIFLKTSQNQLLIGCSNGLFVFNEKENRFTPYKTGQEQLNEINGLAEDIEGNLWISSKEGIKCFNYYSNTFRNIPPGMEAIKKVRSKIYIDSANRLWCNTQQGVSVYDIFNQSIRVLAPLQENNKFRCFSSDSQGNTWIGDEYGILVYDKDLNLRKHFEQSNTSTNNLNDNPVYSIYKDRANNMWIGCYFGGINYYLSGTERFKIYPYGYSSNHLSGKAIRQILPDKSNGIYIATEDGGLNYIDSQGGNIRGEELSKTMDINYKNIHSLLLDSQNNLWIGFLGKGAKLYNLDTKNSETFSPQTLQNRYSGFCLLMDNDKDIWYAGTSGFTIFTQQDKSFQQIRWNNLFDKFIFTLINAPDGTVWAGTRRNGLFRIDKKKQVVTALSTLPVEELFITYLYVDSKQQIWAGTNNYGLMLLNKNGKLITRFQKDQIGSNSIKGIIEDNYGKIWFGTDNGLCCIDSTRQIRRYTTIDGLPINQFNYSSACKTTDGKLHFGTINGMISFDPKQLLPQTPKFNVTLTALWINGLLITPQNTKSILKTSFSESEKIILTHNEAQSIRIEYSGLNYQYNNQTQYAMKMEGIDKEWQNVGNQHQVRFSNLPPGEHCLRIQASKDGINWDKNGERELLIIVLPPYWLSGWAYALYIICLIILLYFSYRYTQNRLKLKLQLKAEHELRINTEILNQQKLNFFTYVSHDLKTPLTLILSPLQRLVSQEHLTDNDKDKINTVCRNANRMHFLIEELLTFSKIEMKQMAINVRKGNIMQFLEEMASIFNIISKEKEIDFIVKVEDNTEEVWFSPSKLERIMYNLLSNAFKYTQPGDFVQLTAKLEKNDSQTFVRISVKDSGRGIPAEALDKIFENYYQVEKKDQREGFGLGLSLTKSLVEMHKGTIQVESSVDRGANFTVTLNVSEQAYNNEEKTLESISSTDIQKYNLHLKETIELIPAEFSANNHTEKKNKDTILIVEDNKDMNQYLKDIFSNEYDIIQTYNGVEACKILEKKLPQLIISDVMMPIMDGLSLVEHIKQNISTSHIPVILLTAKTEETDHTQGYLKGADAYITKPFNTQHLELLVKNMQKSRESTIDHFKHASELNITQITKNPRDEKFIQDIFDLIMGNIDNEDFGVTEIVSSLHISRSLLHTKLKSLTGCSITQFMRNIKMKEGKKHLQNGMNVSEASFAVGITDPNYFTKCFKKEFDITPTDFIKNRNL